MKIYEKNNNYTIYEGMYENKNYYFIDVED